MNIIQKELYTIYLETKKVCDQLGVKLMAAGGTLLGAVRHKGFIPWDDDMDFFMLREEYDKFCKEGPKIIDTKYFIQTHQTDHDWYKEICRVRKNNTTAIEGNPFTKSHQGLWIDILPLDFFPESNEEFKNYIEESKLLLERLNFHWSFQLSTNFKRKINRLYIFRFTLLKRPFLNLTFKKFDEQARKYNKLKSNYLGSFWVVLKCSYLKNIDAGRIHLFPKEYFENVFETPFENTTITVIKEYDKFLKQQYGNWREIPPPEKRNNQSKETLSFHRVHIVDVNKDYREYIKNKNLMRKICDKY